MDAARFGEAVKWRAKQHQAETDGLEALAFYYMGRSDQLIHGEGDEATYARVDEAARIRLEIVGDVPLYLNTIVWTS